MPQNVASPSTGTTPPPPMAPQFSNRLRYWLLHTQLTTERASFDAHWKMLNSVLFPRRGRFTLTDANRGDRRNQNIIDSSATFAAATLARGMMTGTTSRARDWFRLTTHDPALAELATVKRWLDELTVRMRTVLLQSNFYKVIYRVYGDLGVYGTAAFIIEDDPVKVIRCRDFPVGSYCLANDENLQVRTLSRQFRMTTRQLVSQFGWAAVSSQVQNAWNNNLPEAWWDVIHVIAPNDRYNPARLESKYKKYLSIYFEQGATERGTQNMVDDKTLRESGYDEFPVSAARWDCTSEDVYATDCPGMTALGDILQLQFMAKKGMQALEKHISPPLVAPTSLERKAVLQLPGGVSYDDTEHSRGLRPLLDVRPDLDKLNAAKMDVRQLINQAFLTNVFLMNSFFAEQAGGKTNATATEITARQEEKMLALGPLLTSLDQDVYDPVINRVFHIMLRQGKVPPPPPEMEGQELKVEYISIFHAAQRAAGLGALERITAFSLNIAERTKDMSRLDKIDFDEAIDEYGDGAGVSPRVIRSADQVAAIRQQRAKQQQEEQEASKLKDMAQSAQSLSQADTSGKNALTDLIAAKGGGAAGGGAR